MRNAQVAECWGRNQPATAGNLRTDGDELYSYGLLIGYTTPKGTKVALNYTASGKYYSQTTSCHVGLAARNADELMHPVTHEVMTN